MMKHGYFLGLAFSSSLNVFMAPWRDKLIELASEKYIVLSPQHSPCYYYYRRKIKDDRNTGGYYVIVIHGLSEHDDRALVFMGRNAGELKIVFDGAHVTLTEDYQAESIWDVFLGEPMNEWFRRVNKENQAKENQAKGSVTQ